MISKILINPKKIKKQSEQELTELGAKTLDWLPYIEKTNVRKSNEIASRALIVNALIQIYFKAPVEYINEWITKNNLKSYLTPNEHNLLQRKNEDLTEQEMANLYWLIEALWAFMWIGKQLDDLSPVEPVGNSLAGMFPNLEKNEPASAFYDKFSCQSYKALYKMRDIYYRSHWYARDGDLNGYDTGNFSLDIIMARRRALEWAMNIEEDWDNVNMGT